jgi:hypothetical protein
MPHQTLFNVRILSNTPHTHGLCWHHHTCKIAFSLVVDDFLIKSDNKANADHLIHPLDTLYTISTTTGKPSSITDVWTHHQEKDYAQHTTTLTSPSCPATSKQPCTSSSILSQQNQKTAPIMHGTYPTMEPKSNMHPKLTQPYQSYCPTKSPESKTWVGLGQVRGGAFCKHQTRVTR